MNDVRLGEPSGVVSAYSRQMPDAVVHWPADLGTNDLSPPSCGDQAAKRIIDVAKGQKRTAKEPKKGGDIDAKKAKKMPARNTCDRQ